MQTLTFSTATFVPAFNSNLIIYKGEPRLELNVCTGNLYGRVKYHLETAGENQLDVDFVGFQVQKSQGQRVCKQRLLIVIDYF